jgi:hypothetical protein
LKALPEKLASYDYDQLRGAAKRWVEAYKEREREILKEKKDPHDLALWASFYEKWGRPLTLAYPRPTHPWDAFYWVGWRGVTAAIGLVVGLFVLLRIARRKRPVTS